jgi:hypothetical protein
MAIVVEGTTTGGLGNTGGDSTTLTSWTPVSNELVMLFVAMRDEAITPTASGNGITFTQIHDIDNVQAQGGLTVLRGMSASPSTGTITVTHTSNIRPTSCIAVRFSGVDTSGTNGSGAIGNTATDTGPDPDDDDALISVTIDDSDNFAVFSAWSRSSAILWYGGQSNKMPRMVSDWRHRQRTGRRCCQLERKCRPLRISNRGYSGNGR